MEPTIHCARPDPGCLGADRDVIVVETSGSEGLERGDIVVFRASSTIVQRCGAGTTGEKYVKRIVGLPGEMVHLTSTGLHIDGEPIPEPYLGGRPASNPPGRWRVEPDTYFLLGDNRPASCDSRVYGGVPADAIIGKVVAIERGGERIDVAREAVVGA
jgi:signal peptidase I